ncbi:hypothetical protein ABEG18_10995 [Alsobacter sp. KACC 23698]|uniref:Uncharacterized protein n=1 Tax=Alsobacter sp. KACC 23698 TaxID=3149229 RepID=A0AAU7JLF6_9HYPH
MNALLDFTRKAHESKRIGFGDLRRLQRDILPAGVATAREAELLLALDGALARADKGWTDFLAGAVSSFALGRAALGLDEETAAWLQRAASAARPATAAAVLKRARRDAAAAHGARQETEIRPTAAEPSEALRPAWEWLASGYQVEVRPAGRNGAPEELLSVE